MDKLYIKASKTTPEIIFDPDNNHFMISGRSLPEDPGKFYFPILNSINKFHPPSNAIINIDIRFSYVSSASIIAFLELLKLFKLLENKGCEVKINWHHHKDDEDIVGVGDVISKLSELRFKYISFN